jgi:hypothetical protein
VSAELLHHFSGLDLARITNLERATFARRSLHDPVASCLYDFYDVDGERLLQINTYGRAGRQTPEKPSQVVQLDEDGARRLRAVLNEAFPTLR